MVLYLHAVCAVLVFGTPRQDREETGTVPRIGNLLQLVEEASARRDGGLGAIIDTAIAELLLIGPQTTLAWLVQKEDIRNAFLNGFQVSVFTDYKGTDDADLRKLRRQLIDVLDGCQMESSAGRLLREDLVSRLKGLRIRRID